MRTAHSALLDREQLLIRRELELDPMSAEALAALIGERDRAASLADRRLALLAHTDQVEKRPSLAEFVESRGLTEFSPMTPLGAVLGAQAAGSAWGDEVLTTILQRLVSVPDMTLSELTLANDGRAQAVPGLPDWLTLEAQLVLTASLPEVLSCLESLAPDAAYGLPVLTVQTASLRRIDPERWGTAAHERHGPPVQLSATLAIFVPAQPTGEN
jgi:hypothetical protein